MKPVQLLLLGLIIVGLWVYLQFLRSRSRDRFFVVAIFIASAALVLMPGVASRLATMLQVGRGVDLVMYLAILLLGFFNLLLYSRMRQLRQQFIQLARHTAISEARRPTPGHNDGPLHGAG
jgi:hypothetical protein